MRLLRLDLLRYGHLTDIRLDFPREARLHVVLGANEAGKSTALSAIGDALFGFPHSTPYAFLHDGNQLRLGFTVEAADGAQHAFLRRKGRKDTLRDEADQPVPEAMLQALLGHASRELFETAHGLNGETLRRGALALLASGGEAGESLLAGMGLPHLRKALERLDAEARALHGDGRGRRALAVATEAWNERRRQAEEAAIRPRDWTEAMEEKARVGRDLEAAHAQADRLGREASMLERVRRILPVLAPLDAARRELEELGEGPELPAEAGPELRRLTEALRQAEEDRRRETDEARRVEAVLAELPQDPAILAIQVELEALVEQRGAIAEAERSLDAMQRQVDAYREEVAAAGAELGSVATPEATRDALPRPADRQAAQRLIRRRTELATAAAREAAALRAAERRREEARARLAAGETPSSAVPLRRAIAKAREEGQLDREIAAAEQALVSATRRAQAALQALPLWSGDAAALAACPVPLPASAADVAARMASARGECALTEAALAAASEEIATLEAELAHLARGETVPTREVIAAARERRDAAWRRLRALQHGAAPDAGDGELPFLFEAARDEADRLADARADDAQRVNDYAAKSARLAVLRARLGEVVARRDAAAAQRDQAAAAWTALWSPAGIVPQGEAAMAEWRRQRDEALRIAALEEEARERCRMLAERLQAARDPVLALLPDAEAPTLAALLERAEARCAELEAAEAAHRRLIEQAEQEARRAEDQLRAAADAEATLRDFDTGWREAAAALGLPPDASAEAVEGALAAWTRVAEAAKAWRADATRLADMQDAIARFAAATGAILAQLGLAPTEEAPTLTVARLAQRLAKARDAARDASALARQVRDRRAAAEDAAGRHAAAESAIAALRAQAAAADLPALEAAIARAERRVALRARIAGLQEDLLQQGAGLTEAALREEAAAVDADLIAVRLEAIAAEQAGLRESLTALGAAQRDVEARLAAMQAGRDAAMHAQEARQHLAEAQAVAERYARLHLARTLLQAGIERIRQERQAPLLRSAGQHFALLTGGRYQRLSTDEDEGGRTLLRAVAEDGSECPVEGLSEGTRDQLYLTLRIAAIEAGSAEAEPLPFIADDLLATFDDGRASAAIGLLARLGATTQTILFTHHAHIADLAAREPGVSVQTLPTPSTVAERMTAPAA